jgi:S-formylglutathione hydrolase FrmB
VFVLFIFCFIHSTDTFVSAAIDDMGIGAGFYVNATEEPYNKHYKMYTYITEELPALLEKEFKIGMFGLRAISGQ